VLCPHPALSLKRKNQRNFITESYAFLKALLWLTVVEILQRNVVSRKSSLLLSFKKEAGLGRAQGLLNTDFLIKSVFP